jgi:hypothetical protein
MEPVLNRALPAANVSALKSKYTASHDAFFDGIVEQRAFEFAGEQLRKADLIRWGIIDQKMAEARQKVIDLGNRTGDYSYLATQSKIYYFINPNDNETIITYGFEMGEDENGSAAWKTEMKSQYGDDIEIHSTNWFVDEKTSTNKLDQDYADGLYVVTPSLNCVWPIWKKFIDNSNGMLNNDGHLGQL